MTPNALIHRATRELRGDLRARIATDVTAVEALSRLMDELHRRGIALRFARVNRPLRETLERIGLREQLGKATYFPSVHVAVETFQQEG